MKKNETLFIILLVVGTLMLLSMFIILSIPVSAKEEETTENLFTSEELEAIEKANHLTDEEHDRILNASNKFLNSLDTSLFETSNSSHYDNHFYLSSSEMIFDSNESDIVILDAIYRMLLSIRNILLLFLCGVICAWFHKMFSRIIQRLGGRSKL